MTRKRFIKVLMACGVQRNKANEYARFVGIFDSYLETLRAIAGR